MTCIENSVVWLTGISLLICNRLATDSLFGFGEALAASVNL